MLNHKIILKHIVIFPIVLIIALICFSCKNETYKNPKEKKEQEKQMQEALIKTNKYLVKKDAEIISSFVKRQQYNMQETRTGLWYEIYEHGNGIKAKTDKFATISYAISLLDGTVCYKTEDDNPKKFRIGQGGVESGLEEAILYLREGDKARIIIPPHLAHGLLGDENKIPPRAIIMYDLELVKVTDN